MAGGLLVTVLLAMGMAWSIARLSSNGESQIEQVRAEERQITLAERLRWNVELIVSIGKGYFITEEPALLSRLDHARGNMRLSVAALSAWASSESDAVFIEKLEQIADRFDRSHEELIAASAQTGTPELLLRFETDVLPLKRELADSLDELIRRKEASLAALYERSSQERNALRMWLYGFLSVLVVAGAVITAFFAVSLSRTYRAERMARDTARQAASAREQLLGVVAHDLRNPLNAISMKATLLQRIASSPMAKQQAESIISIAARMDHLIRGMLDLATIEAGRLSVCTAPCSVASIAETMTDVFAPLCTAKQITLRCTLEPRELQVNADRDRVLQVLYNLLGNAVKFTPVGSEITLEVRREGTWATFCVADQGPGVPPEQQPQVFDRFWRSTGSAVKGTGLGLFIAKGIVNAHGGKIWIDTSTNGGARFHFTLPAVDSISTNISEGSEAATECLQMEPFKKLLA